MSGTSYLAVAQWFTAAEQPPHLTTINPWEDVSDVYRDLVLRGGVPDTGFAGQLQNGSFFGTNQKEDILAEVAEHPLRNDLWQDKIPDFDQFTVPACVVANYANTPRAPQRSRPGGWRPGRRCGWGVSSRRGGADQVLPQGTLARPHDLGDALSTTDVHAHSFDRVEKLSPGEIVELQIDLLPLGLAFHAGERLRFVISARTRLGTMMPRIREYVGASAGQHVILTRGEHAPCLQLPVRGT